MERQHLRAIAWALAGRGATIAAALGVNMIAARLLDHQAFGQFLVCLTLIAVGGMICPLGLNATAVRNLTAILATGRRDQALSAVATIMASAVLGGIALAAIILGPGAGIFYRLISSAPLLAIGAATAISTAAFGMQFSMAEVLRAAGRIASASFAGGAASGVFFAAMLACLWLEFGTLSLGQILLIQAFAAGVSLVLFLPALVRAYGGFPHRANFRQMPRMIWDSLPGGMLYPAFNLLVQIDLLALSYFRPGELAVYGAANRLVLLLTVPGVVIEAALAQSYAKRLLLGDRASLQALAREATCIAALGAIPIFAVYVLAGDRLAEVLFGRDFAASGHLLAILSSGYIAAALVGPGILLLVLGGRQRLALGVLCACMVPFAGAVILAARYGGAEAVAICVAVGIWGVYLAFALTVRLSLGVWVFATPAAALSLLRRSANSLGRHFMRA